MMDGEVDEKALKVVEELMKQKQIAMTEAHRTVTADIRRKVGGRAEEGASDKDGIRQACGRFGLGRSHGRDETKEESLPPCGVSPRSQRWF